MQSTCLDPASPASKRQRTSLSPPPASLTPSPSPPFTPTTSCPRPSLSSLPSSLSAAIFELLPLRTKLLTLTRISHSFPPLTPPCFRLDHLHIGEAAAEALTSSASLRRLLAQLPSIQYGCGEDDYVLSGFQACFRARPPARLRSEGWRSSWPPLFPHLRCVSLSLGARPPHGDEEEEERAHRRRARRIRRFFKICSRRLSVISLGIEQEDLHRKHFPRLLAAIGRLPYLHTLRLSGCEVYFAKEHLPLLLSLPVTWLDVRNCRWQVFNEVDVDTLPPVSPTLTTLVLPWRVVEDPAVLLHGRHHALQSLAVHHLRAQTPLMCDVIVSQTALTSLRLEHQEGFDLRFLVAPEGHEEGTPGRPLLPLLQDFAFLPKDGDERPFSYETSHLNLLCFLSAYQSQLRRLYLQLIEAFTVDSVLLACAQCPRLEWLTVFPYHFCEDGPGARARQLPDPSTLHYPLMPHLTLLEVDDVGTEERLMALLRSCPALRQFLLWSSGRGSRLTASVLPAVGRACRQLQRIRLSKLSGGISPATLCSSSVDHSSPSSSSSSFSSAVSAADTEVLFPALKSLVWMGSDGQLPMQWLVTQLSGSPIQHLRLPHAGRFDEVHLVEPADLLLLLSALPSLGPLAQVPPPFVRRCWPLTWTELETELSTSVLARVVRTGEEGESQWGQWVEERVLGEDGGRGDMDGREAFLCSLRTKVRASEQLLAATSVW